MPQEFFLAGEQLLFLKSTEEGTCILWSGRQKRKANGMVYGFVQGMVGPIHIRMLAHRFAYCVWHRLTPDELRQTDLLSHLCGNALCVNGGHLVRETSAINNQRKTCHSEGHCFGHLGPDCVIGMMISVFGQFWLSTRRCCHLHAESKTNRIFVSARKMVNIASFLFSPYRRNLRPCFCYSNLQTLGLQPPPQ